MSSHLAVVPESLGILKYPYRRIDSWSGEPFNGIESWRGACLVWRLRGSRLQTSEYEALLQRPFGLPLVIVLPHPDEVSQCMPLLARVHDLHPRAVLPTGPLDSPSAVHTLMKSLPQGLPALLTSYLTARGILGLRTTHNEIHRILELAPDNPSISKLARRMYTSRRTLGRHFSDAGLPVPSHWLQFARLMHVCVALQAGEAAVFRIAHRANYPDGFTMSNQMKRILGVRPSDVRKLAGWEWIVESWLVREGILRNSLEHESARI